MPSAVLAQSGAQNDVEARLLASIEKRVSSQFRFFVSPEMRSEDTELNRYLVETGAKFKQSNFFSLRSGYRYGLEMKREREETKHRVRFDAVGKLPRGDFTPALRFRYQMSFAPDAETRHRFRYRLQLGYRLSSRWGVSASLEPWQDLRSGSFTRVRYGAGVGWEFFRKKLGWTKLRQALGLDYRLDYELDEALNTHIIRLSYKLLF